MDRPHILTVSGLYGVPRTGGLKASEMLIGALLDIFNAQRHERTELR